MSLPQSRARERWKRMGEERTGVEGLFTGREVAERRAAVDDEGELAQVGGQSPLPAVGDDGVEGVVVGRQGVVGKLGLFVCTQQVSQHGDKAHVF